MSSPRRSGFTLAEVAVSAAIIAMLAAVTMPSLATFIDRQRVQTTADRLEALASGVAAFAAAVKTTAASTSTAYPGLISELANQIAVNSTVTHNSCGSAATGTFNATATANWSTNGPFVSFYVPVGGLKTPIGFVSDSMVRSPSTATAGTLALRILSADTADANMLDQVVDGGDGATAGTVQYTIVSARANISYLLPVGAKC
jgi:prepilin-type N-terminal cleavage/methylation domain-containing protein